MTPYAQLRENFLFDTGKVTYSFFGPRKFDLPYLTLGLKLAPNFTMPSIFASDGVNSRAKIPSCP
jgi:hypothetical protein